MASNCRRVPIKAGKISWRVKRLCDIIGALLLLLASSPIILIASLAIFIEDRGPIIFSQRRTGLYGSYINVFKLRSMASSADENVARWATANDPRITKVGKYIRKFRIDELPQLINVLLGDMSLIGPRPEQPQIEDSLERLISHYRIRHWVRPGLSGWAQVCYPYGASILDSRIKLSYDIYYLRNYTFGLDILILAKTISMLIRGIGSTPVIREGK